MEETHMMLVALVKIVVASQHKRQRKKSSQDLLRNENTDSGLKVGARAALCKLSYSYASDLPFKNFCTLAKQAETIKTGLGYD